MLVPADSYLIVSTWRDSELRVPLRHLVALDAELTFCGRDADALIYHGTHTGDVWASYVRHERACAICEAQRRAYGIDELSVADRPSVLLFGLYDDMPDVEPDDPLSRALGGDFGDLIP